MSLVASPNRLTFVMNEYFVKQRKGVRCNTNGNDIDGDLVQFVSHKCTSIKQSIRIIPMAYDVALNTLTNT